MNNLRAALEQALQLHQAGNLKQAEALYGKILQQHPGQPDALNLLGYLNWYFASLGDKINQVRSGEVVTRIS
jgi:hypothetical protein